MRIPIVVLVCALAACNNASSTTTAATATPTTQAELPDRDPALAHRLVAQGAVLVDVRTPEEYAARHIDGAVNIPVDDLAGRVAEVSKGDTSKPVVVYCHSGNRAGRAKKILVEHGYSQVTNLGGIDDWDKK